MEVYSSPRNICGVTCNESAHETTVKSSDRTMMNQGYTDLYVSPVNLDRHYQANRGSPRRGNQAKPTADWNNGDVHSFEGVRTGDPALSTNAFGPPQTIYLASSTNVPNSGVNFSSPAEYDTVEVSRNYKSGPQPVPNKHAERDSRIRMLELSVREKALHGRAKADNARKVDDTLRTEHLIDEEFGDAEVRKEAEHALSQERHRRQREEWKWYGKEQMHRGEENVREMTTSAKVKSSTLFDSCKGAPSEAQQLEVGTVRDAGGYAVKSSPRGGSVASPRSAPYSSVSGVTPRKTNDFLCCNGPKGGNVETFKLYPPAEGEQYPAAAELWSFAEMYRYSKRFPEPRDLLVMSKKGEANEACLDDCRMGLNLREMTSSNIAMHVAGKTRAAEILMALAADVPEACHRPLLKRCGVISGNEFRDDVLIPAMIAFRECSEMEIERMVHADLPLWQSCGFALSDGNDSDLILFFKMDRDGRLRSSVRPITENCLHSRVALDFYMRTPGGRTAAICDEFEIFGAPNAVVKTREAFAFAHETLSEWMREENMGILVSATIVKEGSLRTSERLNGMDMAAEMRALYRESQLIREDRNGGGRNSDGDIYVQKGGLEMCDVAISCQGKTMMGSRPLLMARSKEFARMLATHPKGAAILINGSNPELCSNMLEFIHGDTCPILERNDITLILPLLELAAKFRVPSLGYACSMKAGSLIGPASALQIYESACRVNNPYLKAACTEYGLMTGKQVTPIAVPAGKYRVALSPTQKAALQTTQANLTVDQPTVIAPSASSYAHSESSLSSLLSAAEEAEAVVTVAEADVLRNSSALGVPVMQQSAASSSASYSGVYRDSEGNYTNVAPAPVEEAVLEAAIAAEVISTEPQRWDSLDLDGVMEAPVLLTSGPEDVCLTGSALPAVEVAAVEAEIMAQDREIVTSSGVGVPLVASEVALATAAPEAVYLEDPAAARAERVIEDLVAEGVLEVETTATGEKKLKKSSKGSKSEKVRAAPTTKPVASTVAARGRLDPQTKKELAAVVAASSKDGKLSPAAKIKVAEAVKDGKLDGTKIVEAEAKKKKKVSSSRSPSPSKASSPRSASPSSKTSTSKGNVSSRKPASSSKTSSSKPKLTEQQKKEVKAAVIVKTAEKKAAEKKSSKK